MKITTLFSPLILLCLLISAQSCQGAQKIEDIDPCGLIEQEKMYEVFPSLQKMEKTKTGPLTMCSYLNKYDIPTLITSVTKAPKNVRDPLLILGSGYRIEEVPGLGDDAAIAIQQPTPKYGIKAGIAALHIIKGEKALNLSFMGPAMLPGDPKFEQVKLLAAGMINNMQ